MLAVTLTKLRNTLQHALGGRAVASQLDQDDIINEAGRMMVSLRPWRWLDRASTLLSLTSGQSYVTAPTNMREVVSLLPADTERQMIPVTLDRLNQMRRLTGTGMSVIYWSISQPTQASTTTDMGAMRFEIWPTPTATESDALRLVYKAIWTDFASGAAGTEKANMPAFMDSLLIDLVRARAQQYEDGHTQDALRDVLSGVSYTAAVMADTAMRNPMMDPSGGWMAREVNLPEWTYGGVSGP